MSDEYDLLGFEVEQAAKADAETRAGRPSRRTVEGRRMREKKPLAADDGRKRARKLAERDVAQLNSTVRRELKTAVVQAARIHGMSMREIVEAALSDYLAKLDKPQRGRHA